MKPQPVLVVLATLFSVSPLLALDLGQTEQALTKRYGAPTSNLKNPTAEKTLTYESPGTLIEVELRQGKCVSFSLTKIGSELSPTEAKRILDANAEGKRWNHEDNSPEVWRREDGVMAYVNSGFIHIVTPDQVKQSSGVSTGPGASLAPATPAPKSPATK